MFIDEAKKLGNVTLVDFNELEKTANVYILSTPVK